MRSEGRAGRPSFRPAAPQRSARWSGCGWVFLSERCRVSPLLKIIGSAKNRQSKTTVCVRSKNGLRDVGRNAIASSMFTCRCPLGGGARRERERRLAAVYRVREGNVICFLLYRRDLMSKMATMPDWHCSCPHTQKPTELRPHSSPCRLCSRNGFPNMLRPSSSEYPRASSANSRHHSCVCSACQAPHEGVTSVSPRGSAVEWILSLSLFSPREAEVQGVQATCPTVL